MDNTREKLMSLIWHKQDCGLTHNANGQDFVTYNAELADHLIANGVTVQEWISVKDRLPELNEIVLAVLNEPNKRLNYPYEEKTLLLFRRGYKYITGYEEKWERPFGAETRDYNDEVTHWMPLPEPPKEG